ncbi:FAD-dependent oxidoreductase [Actinomycetospora aeridis]|uniref:FAD-dependent oxidoreductase n=1 Tax=Actinomycetospora aeridis TaxID=3129231 RepID=A0ABU8NB61_9PSEU
MRETEVVVVGGGPTGMTVAGDLARAGRSVVLLERWPRRHPGSRAFATMPRTLEVLDSRLADGPAGGRSVTDALLEHGTTVPRVNLWPGAAVRLGDLDSPHPYVLVAPQTVVDELLEQRARAEGVTVVRGSEVVGLVQDADGVTVTTAGDTSWRAPYVVAADGAHSTVRRLLGADFPGREVLSSVVLADVRLAHPPATEGLTLGTTPEVFGFLAPYGDGRYRSMTWDRRRQLPDDAPVEDDDVAGVLDRAMGRPVGAHDISGRSRFHCEERQVTRYRHARVFLAGDAAHVHSPMGGQGMNTGIQDAANLAWKLDAALAGADDSVLESYHAERHPIGRRVLRQSGAMMRAVTLHPRPARALRNAVSGRLLAWRPFGDLVAGSFSGVGLRYGRRRGDHPLVGTNAATIPLATGTVAARQRHGGFLVIRETDRRDTGPAVLVRPDGYVAWAGSSADGDDGRRRALAAWSGPAATPAHDLTPDVTPDERTTR